MTVIDDDESIRESVPDLLKTYGFAAEAFASAEDFLASGRIDEARCLVVDVAMPGMSGPDLLREVRRRHHEVPVVFITAYESQVDRDRLTQLDAVAILYKPFDATELVDVVKIAVGLR